MASNAIAKKGSGGGGGGGDASAANQVIQIAQSNYTERYLIEQVDETGSTYNYYGYEDAAGKWYIKRINISSPNQLTMQFFKGTGGLNTGTNWSSRAGYTYVDFKDLALS